MNLLFIGTDHLDDTFDTVYGGQQLRLFNGHHDDRSDSHYSLGRGQQAPLHYCCPEVLFFCWANGLKFIFGVAPTATLRRDVEALEQSTLARFEAGTKTVKIRRFREFYDGAASWSRVERIIARVEAGEDGTDTRCIVTNLEGGRVKALYQDVYCQRGCMENHIKSWKTHLAADRTSRQARRPPTSSGCSCTLALTG